MAVKLNASYSKKLGLPQYSSHSFSASVEVELTDLSQVEDELQKLYELLQQSVDQEIQHPGFVPQTSHPGSDTHRQSSSASGRCGPSFRSPNSGSRHPPSPNQEQGDRWNCTDGQRGLILRIVNENNLNRQEVEDLARQLFNTGVMQLNKMQASQLIEDLLVKAGKPRDTRWRQPAQRNAA